MEYIKQSMNNIWAAAGDVVMPEAVKIAEGWLVEVPPRQYWNWMQNRTDVNLAYIFQRGVPEWDISVEYLANKSFVVYNGVVYKCILTGVGKNPESQPTYWVRAFRDWSAIGQAVDNLTPAADRFVYYTGANTAALGTVTSFARSILDDTSAAAVRTTIGAQASDATLTAVAGVTTAANKLIYFTGVDTAAATDLSAFGRSLIDDADASAARTTLGLASGATTTVGTIATQNANAVSITGGSITGITDLAVTDGGTGASTAAGARSNLGLGTAAVADVTTSNTDTTAGRVMKTGDFGLGAGQVAVSDCNSAILTGFYVTSGSAANRPAGATASVWMSVFGNANTVVHQYCYDPITSNVHYRRLSSSVWSEWRKFFHSGNQLDIGTTAASARTALGLGTAAVGKLTESTTDDIVGKVLKVGDFGIGSNAVTLTGVDMNTVVRTGFYISTSPVNGPTVTTTNLLVLGNTSGSGRTMQIAQPVNGEAYYVRSQSVGTWSTWKQLIHSGNINTLITDSSSQSFGTGGVESVRISNTGNLGVGTIAPGARLSIDGASSDAWAPGNSSGLAINGTGNGISTISTFLDSSSLRIGAGVTQKTGLFINGQTASGGSYVSVSAAGAEQARFDNKGLTTGNITHNTTVRPYGTNGADIRVFRNVASYSVNNSASVVGTVKITLPFSWNTAMLTMKIKGYNYNSTGYWELNISGQPNGNASEWRQTSVDTAGTSTPFTSVRFGHDGTRCCILLGTTTTSLSYPKIIIDELMVSFAAGTSDWTTGWSISQVTNETGITVSSTPIIGEIGGWIDVRPYLASPFDWDTTREGRNAFPQARVVNGKVEFRGVVRYNVTDSTAPSGVMFQNLPANLRPKYTLGGVGFCDTASPLRFGSYSWIAGGEVEYGVPHGNVTVIMLNTPTPFTNAAFVLDQMSWFVN